MIKIATWLAIFCMYVAAVIYYEALRVYDKPLAVVVAECPTRDYRAYRHNGRMFIYTDGELRRFVPASDCSLIDTGGFARFEGKGNAPRNTH